MFLSSWAIKSSHSGALDLIIQLGIGHVIEFKSVSIWKMFVQDKEGIICQDSPRCWLNIYFHGHGLSLLTHVFVVNFDI